MRSLELIMGDFNKFFKNGLPRNKVNDSILLVNTRRTQWDSYCFISKIVKYCDPHYLHVVFLLALLVDTSTYLLGTEEAVKYLFINVVWDPFFHYFDVVVEFGEVPVWGMRILSKEFLKVILWFALFREERENLVDEVRLYISILIFPPDSEV